jgi:hypothetical protein
MSNLRSLSRHLQNYRLHSTQADSIPEVDWQSPSNSFHGADPSSLLSLHSVPMLFQAQKYTLNLRNITLVPTKVCACDIEFCSVNNLNTIFVIWRLFVNFETI